MRLDVAVDALRGDVEAWLREPGAGEVVKDNRVRSVHRWKGIYVKRFKHPGFVQKLRSWVDDRAAREFRLLREARARGFDAPEPVAWARDGASTFLFTREVADARVLRELPFTRDRLSALAGLVRRIHREGLRHDDLHVGNVLEAGGKLVLLDLHRARFGPPMEDPERVRSVAFLVLSFYTFVTRADAVRFVRACGTDPRATFEAFRAARERYWRDRQSRVRRTGSAFEVVDGLVLRRPYGEGAARRALSATPLRVVKELPRRRLWLADEETFVKEGAPDVWYNGFGLETRGIPTPRLLAVSGDRVVGRWIGGALPLWEHFQAHGVDRRLLWELAVLVRRMHSRGVHHRDLKANNILVRDGAFWVIDLDRVDFSREVGREGRLENLAQLNAAVGAPVTRADRLRFFFAYAGRDREMRRGWKEWVREVMRRTVARGHHWPRKEA